MDGQPPIIVYKMAEKGQMTLTDNMFKDSLTYQMLTVRPQHEMLKKTKKNNSEIFVTKTNKFVNNT